MIMENTNQSGQQQSQSEETKNQPTDKQTPHNDLSKEDIPDSTNESTGTPGSGQRQDSN
jgi:hypothetical protein